MRKLFALVLFCFLLQIIYAQPTDSTKRTLSIEAYTKKRTTYNAIGWTMLGTGVVLAGYSYYHYFIKNGANGTWELEPMFFVGSGLTIASVPFFILARKNKIKAELALRKEQLLSTVVFSRPYYPAFALQIHW